MNHDKDKQITNHVMKGLFSPLVKEKMRQKEINTKQAFENNTLQNSVENQTYRPLPTARNINNMKSVSSNNRKMAFSVCRDSE